ncbi:hypothetical protein [Bacillus cereus group sp. MYBK57-1]|uniref:hypothetical protein n=1 Tax=Bacillus cereus group sp. MYBK57-1 TaxID=3450619 RepID=UPI003F7ACCB6
MNLPIAEACFIDANIIFYIHDMNQHSFPDIIEKVYEKVIIHPKVLEELGPAGQGFARNKIDLEKWILFDDSQLTVTEQRMYLKNIADIDNKLKEIDIRRGKVGSAGTGEIYSLAAASVIHAEYICSNDYSIQDVIQELPLKVYPNGDDEQDPEFIKQHRFLDLCRIICDGELLERNHVYRCYKTALRSIKLEDREHFNELLEQFHAAIPVPTLS